MTVRTCVRSGAEDWQRMQDDLVSVLAGRGVLHCAGVASALLDTGEAMSQRRRSDRQGQDGPGAP